MTKLLTKYLNNSLSKRILMVNFKYERGEINYQKFLSKNLNCLFCEWDEFQIIDGKFSLNNSLLSEFSFILIGSVGDNNNLYSSLIECLNNCNIKYFSYGQSNENNNKILQTIKFNQYQVPHPKTIICKASSKITNEIIEKIQFPIISKILNGSQGEGILKHQNKESLTKEIKSRDGNDLIFQESINTSCDYRILFFLDQLVYVQKRSSTKKDEFRHNISLGGSCEEVVLPFEAISIAHLARKSMNFDISGVDLIQDENTKQWYVLEVNSAPQFSKVEVVLEKIISLIKSRI